MNFATIDTTLRTVLNAISGLPVGLAQDDGQSQYFPQVGVGTVTDGHGNTIGTGDNNQMDLTYNIRVASGIGRDELRERYDASVLQTGDTYAGPGAPLGSVIDTMTGNRQIAVDIKSECFGAADGAGPIPMVERIRTAMRLPSVLDLLNTAGLAVQKLNSTVNTCYDDENGRRINVAILEIIFNAADGLDDIPQTTIEIVQPPALTVRGLVTDP